MPVPTKIGTKKAEDLTLPSGSDDPAERKRVLNILAQRRYRKRKREHVKALESQVTETTVVPAKVASEPINPAEENRSSLDNTSTESHLPPREISESQPCTTGSLYLSHEASDFELGQVRLDFQTESQPSINLSGDQMTDLLTLPHLNDNETTMCDWALPLAQDDGQASLPKGVSQPSPWTWAPMAFMPSISLPSTPAADLSFPENESTPSTGLSSSSPRMFSTNCPKTPLPAAPRPPDLTEALQSYQATHQAFTDTRCLHSHLLNIMRGFLSIASLFNVTSLLWSFDATSPFCSATPPSLPPNLPKNLHPTPLQRTTPHHPILDILPWPVTRDKLILVFALPPHQRPPQAQSEMALLDFVYDLEDSSDGVKLWGDCPYREENWEVGSKVFENWWWAFDSHIVRKSNEWRTGRGLARLTLG